MRTLVSLAVGLFMLGIVAGGIARAEVKVGDHFVELDIAKTASGKSFKLRDQKGKWVLFTFGAKWCQPCHHELPAWDRVAPLFKGKVMFVAVNINNDRKEGEEFVKSLHLKHLLPVFMPDDKSAAMKSYDPDHMPSTFVIDPHGIVRLVEYGYDNGDEKKLATKLHKLVK